ncbi:hypothetical protein MASR1M90_01640 [Desulfovibrionales bacterium]
MKYVLTCILACFVFSGCAAHTPASTSQGSRDVQLHLDLVESYINSRQPQRALQELLKVEKQAGGLSRYHFDKGMIFLLMNELDNARDGFAQAAKIDDNFGEAWNNLGKIQEALHLPQEAEASYLKAFSILTYLTPEFPAYNLGILYLHQGRAQDTENYARKALARNWRFLPAYKLLADALTAQNRSADAEKVLRDGLEAGVDNPALLLALAEHLTRTGQNTEARDILSRIIKLHPSTDEAKVARDYLGIL